MEVLIVGSRAGQGLAAHPTTQTGPRQLRAAPAWAVGTFLGTSTGQGCQPVGWDQAQ